MVWVCTQGSILFGAGFCLVVFGWAIVGMIIETYGFVLLFRYMLAYNTCNFPYFRYNYLPWWLRSDHYLNGLYISKLDFEFQMIGFCTNHFFNQWLEWSDVAIEFVFQLQNLNYKFHYRLSFIPHEVFTSRDILIVWSLWGHINACNFLPILVYVIILSFSLRKWDLWMWRSYQSFYF